MFDIGTSSVSPESYSSFPCVVSTLVVSDEVLWTASAVFGLSGPVSLSDRRREDLAICRRADVEEFTGTSVLRFLETWGDDVAEVRVGPAGNEVGGTEELGELSMARRVEVAVEETSSDGGGCCLVPRPKPILDASRARAGVGKFMRCWKLS